MTACIWLHVCVEIFGLHIECIDFFWILEFMTLQCYFTHFLRFSRDSANKTWLSMFSPRAADQLFLTVDCRWQLCDKFYKPTCVGNWRVLRVLCCSITLILSLLL